jgi:hypothetical protein
MDGRSSVEACAHAWPACSTGRPKRIGMVEFHSVLSPLRPGNCCRRSEGKVVLGNPHQDRFERQKDPICKKER